MRWFLNVLIKKSVKHHYLILKYAATENAVM